MLKAQAYNPRKRRNPEPQTLQGAVPSVHICKKPKRHHNSGPCFPSVFWDNLSKIDLTTRALEELGRRNTPTVPDLWCTRRRPHRPLTRGILAALRKGSQPLIPAVDYLRSCGLNTLKSVKQTAKHGGPDLSDLRRVSQSCIPSARYDTDRCLASGTFDFPYPRDGLFSVRFSRCKAKPKIHLECYAVHTHLDLQELRSVQPKFPTEPY